MASGVGVSTREMRVGRSKPDHREQPRDQAYRAEANRARIYQTPRTDQSCSNWPAPHGPHSCSFYHFAGATILMISKKCHIGGGPSTGRPKHIRTIFTNSSGLHSHVIAVAAFRPTGSMWNSYV